MAHRSNHFESTDPSSLRANAALGIAILVVFAVGVILIVKGLAA